MEATHFFRPSLVLGLALLAMLAGMPPAGAQERSQIEIVPLLPHAEAISSVAISPDGKRLASGSGDRQGMKVTWGNTLKLWDAATGQLIRTFGGQGRGVLAVAFSPDGMQLLAGSSDGTLKLWDASSGELIRTFEGHRNYVLSVAFSRDGRVVLSGSRDQTLKLWDAATGQLIRTFYGHSDQVNSVAFSPDGSRLVSGSGARLYPPSGRTEYVIRLWDAATGKPLATLQGHAAEIHSVAFSSDGTRLLSVDHDGTLKVWDAASGQLIRTIEDERMSAAYRISINYSIITTSAAFSPAGVILGDFDGRVRLSDTATGQPIRTFKGHTGGVTSMAISSDGTRLVTGGSDRTLRLWDVVTGQAIRVFGGEADEALSVAFSPDGTRVVASSVFRGAGSRDGYITKTLKLWDATNGRLVRDVEGPAWGAFSPDTSHLISEGREGRLDLWDATTGKLIRSFEGHTDFGTSAVAFSPDGAQILSGGTAGSKTDIYSPRKHELKLWDTATGGLIRTFDGSSSWLGGLIRTFDGHTAHITSLAISPDGKHLVSGSASRDITTPGTELKLWDAATGRVVRSLKGHTNDILSVAFSPDGTRLVSGDSNGTIRVWDTATGKTTRYIEMAAGQVSFTGWVTSVAFSPDGKRVLSRGNDMISRNYELKLWEVSTGRLIRSFEGHSGLIQSAAFDRDGRRIVSASTDRTTRIWDADTGAQLALLIGTRDSRWLALTPAGFFAGSGSANDFIGIVRGLNVTTIDQVHQSLYNPDLVREALAGDPEGEVAKAAKVINLEKVLDSGPPPSVTIASPAGGSQSASDLLEVTARIEDHGKGVGRIEWRVNGITAAVLTKPSEGGPVYTVKQQLALDPGDSTIEVVAYNALNLLASLPAHTTVKFTGPADRARPKLHILAIGINKYEDKGWTPPGSNAPLLFEPLDLAVDDARAFGASMKKAATGLYEDVLVTEVLDQDATRENLPKIVDKVAAQIHPRDTFILFASAHGYSMKTNGRFYLIPQDYQGGPDPEALANRAIGQDQLQDWLATKRIRAKRALILLDTCESGALIAGHTRARADVSEAAVGRLHEATGRPVLTAAALGQSAQEGEIDATGEKHGLFTWAVLDALRNGDSNGNGLIELSELVAHVQNAIPRIVSGKGGSGKAVTSETDWDKQSARFGSRGEDFAIARRLR